MTYEDARTAFEAILEAERTDKRVDPRCYSQLLDRGARAERAIAFYHGFTNCPRQFIAIGERFFDAGFNVYIPRLPGHGMADKMTTALKDVTRDDLTAAAAAAAQLTAGLGVRVHVAGISLGGVLAAWVGDQIPIAGATAIAPFMGIKGVLGPLNSLIASVLDMLPDFFMWWDPRVRANNPATPPYAYARYTSRIIAAQLNIGSELSRRAKRQAPKALASALFANQHDPAVNNSVAARLYQRWRERGANVLQEWFDGPRVHDIIDNFTGRLPVDTIYPAILDFVERADALGKVDA
jgi:esterase/lipase